MSIHILPPEVASQIAAGEVIERPASVVKELLENSIDAGAKFISIQVEDAGKRMIEVADDGCGIQALELALAVERHATSKLQNADDLFKIRTLGFRGEALASIGSVARLTITSRPIESEIGAILRVEGGSGVAVQATGSPVGTVVRVENLFYNVPARLKFLKTDTTERRQIDTLVTRYALAYPNIRFQLKQDGKAALQTSGNGKRREVLAALYGVDVARQMLEVLAEEEGLSIQGFISPTALTRSNRREIVFFVNGRPVQDAALVAALIKAYHTLLMVGRYPLGILFLGTSAESVDVNVHPTKAEVRFRDPSRVFSGVQAAVRRALLAHTPVPRLDQQLRWTPGPGWETPAQKAYPDWQMAQEIDPQPAADRLQADDGAHSGFEAAATHPSPQPELPGARIPLLRLVGQIASAYLVAEGPDGLYLIDQHAAHERVLFERFMAQRSGEIPSQVLLQPATVELPAASARLLEPQLPLLQRLGFEVEVFGSNTYLVRAIPSLLSGSDPAAALRVLVEDFEEDESPLR
jgi:DNA mismatch repair protein MutL